jgi:hypothetical protein
MNRESTDSNKAIFTAFNNIFNNINRRIPPIIINIQFIENPRPGLIIVLDSLFKNRAFKPLSDSTDVYGNDLG